MLRPIAERVFSEYLSNDKIFLNSPKINDIDLDMFDVQDTIVYEQLIKLV
ncbi:hypothetical protein [uncultured Psychroserpens sp.]|nr:hypothetical protein [uncultured Psychroserpens sp.]